jgi:hypothetical protein
LLGNWEDGDCKRSRDWATQSQVVWELGVRVDDQGDREKSRFHNSLWRRKVEVREKKIGFGRRKWEIVMLICLGLSE